MSTGKKPEIAPRILVAEPVPRIIATEKAVAEDAAPAPRILAPSEPPSASPIPTDGLVTFQAVQTLLDAQYNSDNSNKSVICDIIAMYLKGQKILYTEAKTVCEQRMNYLMLPAIFITSVCTILSLVLKDVAYGATIVSSLNGFNAFLLALISYLKLDAKAEAHRTSAYKFDKMQSQLEFSSGKSMFMEVTYEDLVKIINDTEANVREIKETNKFILPEDIRVRYPQLCNMNVFAEVKKVQNQEMLMTNTLKDILNEKQGAEGEARRMLEMKERHVVGEIIGLKDDYLKIDDLFEKEMRVQREKLRKGCKMLAWLKT